MKIVECVPNFSEGRDISKIEAITAAIKSVPNIRLLDVDAGADTNRTVVTFIGPPDEIKEAAFRAIQKAAELIDMSKHHGAHPRMGATDVCPFIPISGVTMGDCVNIAREVGERVGRDLNIPVYLYEYAATKPERKNLADIRTGEYEGLPEKIKNHKWKPDFGPSKMNMTAGATVIGARDVLIAYNVNLNTKDKRLAHEIALNIREAGRLKKDAHGNTINGVDGDLIRIPGKLKAVKAVGWYIEQYGLSQVSINLTNYRTTALHTVFETVREEAEKLGLIVTGSEIVGLVPLEPLLDAGRYFLKKQGKSIGVPESELIAMAVRSMGLDQLNGFDPNKKIIEYQSVSDSSLANKSVNAFIDGVASESPTPGGGSVAALSGALGAALSAMVANLTVGKKGYESKNDVMCELACRSQALKAELCKNIDRDAAAFSAVIEAMRLPKSTPEQIAIRDSAIEEGYKQAIAIPLMTAKLCLEAIEIAGVAAKEGNKSSITDAGVAALTAWAGMEGALLNILVNLKSVKDEKFNETLRAQVSELRKRGKILMEDVVQVLNSELPM